MKLLHVSYFNFKILKNTHFNFHHSTTLLVGRNNSGKTTILEGLNYILKQSQFSETKNMDSHPDYINKKSTSNDYNIFLLVALEEQDLTEIIPELSKYNSLSFMDHRQKHILLTTPIVITLSYDKKDGFNFTYDLLKVIVDERTLQMQFVRPDLDQLLETFVHKLSKWTIFISPDRKLPDKEPFTAFNSIKADPSKDQHIRHYLLRLKEQYPEKFKTFQEEFRKIFYDVELNPVIDRDDGLVKIEVKHDGLLFDINEMGSGFKYLLLIIAKILSLESRIIIIDEPDLNMHPDLIRKFVKYLKNVSGLQLIISSHNETFINEFDDDSIRYVYALKPYSAHVKNIEESLWFNLMEDLGIVISNFGKSRLVSSPLVVLFEGSEKKIFTKLVEKKGLIDKLQQLNVFYSDTGGAKRVPDFQMIDKIDNRKQPIIVVRDRDENSESFIDRQVSRSDGRIFYWKRRDIESYAFSYDGILRTIRRKSDLLRNSGIENELIRITLDEIKKIVRAGTKQLKNEILFLRVLKRYKILELFSDSELSLFKEQNLGKPIDIIIESLLKVFNKKNAVINKKNLRQFFVEQQDLLDHEWKDETILKLCSGKDLRKILNNWLSKFGVTISIFDLIEDLTEVDPDVEELVTKICDTYNMIEIPKIKSLEQTVKLDVILRRKFFSNIEPDSITFDGRKNYVYVKGFRESKRIMEFDNIVGVLDSNTLDHKGSIFIRKGDEKWVDTKRMFFDADSSRLIVSCVYKSRPSRRAHVYDTVYVVKADNKRLEKRIEFYKTTDEGKEGYVADLVFNNKNDKLYVSSVYAEGGKRGLYISNLSKPKTNLFNMGRPGALSLSKMYTKVYSIGNSEEGNPTLYEFDTDRDDSLLIPIRGHPGESYRGPDRISWIFPNLFILTDNLLEQVSLINRKSVNSMINSGYSQVITNLLTGNTFVRQSMNDADTSIISIINDDFELVPCFDLGNVIYFNISPYTGNIFAILKTKPENEYELIVIKSKE